MGPFEEWRATPADEDLRRAFADPDLDDAGWEPIRVPGHWRSTPAFADHDGPLLHRTRFEQPPGPGERRWWLRFDGIFTQGDVWLDGAYLGDTEGYFAAHELEVTEQLRARSEHLLAVEVTCPPAPDRTRPRATTGAFQHGDWVDPDWNPGGIWRPVRLERSGPVRIRRLVTRCVEATAERAVVALTATLDAARAVDVHLRTTVGAVDHGTDRTLAAGPNTVEWTVSVDRPRLWWPHALGEPHLEAMAVEVRLRDGAGSHVSDRRRFRTGLRQVAMRRWIVSVNGERLFCKGTNLAPTRMALADATPQELAADVRLARAAGLDLVRLHGHVARPETYAVADEAGLLVWQDFPLRAGYPRALRWQAQRQAAEMVALLAHHPSVALWSVPDGAVRRAVEKADASRPVVRHPPAGRGVQALRGGASRLSFGWEWGDERDLPGFARALPSQVRFPVELGAQAVPSSDGFVGSDAWPDLDWARLARTHHLQLAAMDRHVPRDGRSYEDWRAATQEHQAQVVRHHVEALRRLKYRPTGGFCQLSFADAHPGITTSVLDHERRPKLAHAALVEACRPVIVVADRLPATVRPGQAIALDVHVVSDRRIDLTGTIEAELRWPGGAHRWAFTGDVPADSCVLVGTLQLEVPDAAGELVLELRGRVGDDEVARVDATTIS